jgi:carbon-monoxide dehydrogenase small subunit
MLSCVMLAASYQDVEITTIEGVAQGGELDAVQEGFCGEGGAQCGFCTPGMIMTAKALLDCNPSPTREQIADALSGNLCRCTGYMQIYDSIEYAVKKRKQTRERQPWLSSRLSASASPCWMRPIRSPAPGFTPTILCCREC